MTAPSLPPPGYRLVWADEFDGLAGAQPDPARWFIETGGSGNGNAEHQYYTADPANLRLDGAGHLVITARQVADPPASGLTCWYGPARYTSGRMNTSGRFTCQYGWVEARLRTPFGQGMWPAFWMLGADFRAAGWPTCGEIDIMEYVGRQPHLVHTTLHGPGYSGADGLTRATTLPGGVPVADDFHVYAVEWQPGSLEWYVDSRPVFRLAPADLPAGAEWVFEQPFFIILNLAVGGGFPGDPDETTTFPQQMLVDYVRVYQR